MFHLQNSTNDVISSYAKVYELAEWVPYAFNHIGCSYILEAYEEEEEDGFEYYLENLERVEFITKYAGGDRVRIIPAEFPVDLVINSPGCESIGKSSNLRSIYTLEKTFSLHRILCSRRFIDAESIKHLPSDWAYNNPKITDLLCEEFKQPFMESNANKTHGNQFDKKCWIEISHNPVAIHLLESNLDMVDWDILPENPAGIKLMKLNPERIKWEQVSLLNNIHLIGLIYKDPDSRLMSDVRKIILYNCLSIDSPEKCDWDFISKFKTYFDGNYFKLWICKNMDILDKEWIFENQVAVQMLIREISHIGGHGHYYLTGYVNTFV
jgi:hypothetical protein